MNSTKILGTIKYKILLYIIGAFTLTWSSIFALESTYIFEYNMPNFLVMFFNFIKSASPLIVALFLLRKNFKIKGFLSTYILGERQNVLTYITVIILFILQFLTFFLFRTPNYTNSAPLSISVFLITFINQFLFGGGLEEGGWRGYLFPALKTKMPILLASILTSIIWALWHLPYFFIPTSGQYGSPFLGYMFITIMLGFTLSAIYMLTKSVLICSVFHAFTNTLTMTMQANMGDAKLLVIFTLISLIGAIVCIVVSKKERDLKLSAYFEEKAL